MPIYDPIQKCFGGDLTPSHNVIQKAHPCAETQPFFSVFNQLTAESPYTLQWTVSFSLKIAPLRLRIWSPSNACFLGPTGVHIPNNISIGSAFLQGSRS